MSDEVRKKMSIDPFHMSGDQKIEVKLRLKLPAKNAIEEYYPGLSQCIKQDNDNTWILTTFTYNLYPLTSSLRHPKILIKEFSYFLMPCHQHGLRINLLV